VRGNGSAHHATASELKEQLEAERRGLPFLVFRDGEDAQRIVTMDSASRLLTIGRAVENDVPLSWDPHASRVHAEISLVGGDWVVDDAGLSTNGTFVNGERLVRRRRLEDRDVLRVGHTHVSVRVPARAGGQTTQIDSAEPPEATVSPAQRKVLRALCRPLADGTPYAMPATNQQIADELFISVDAVKTHMRALFLKFGVDDLGQNQKRNALATRALVTGAVSVDDLVGR
jgi:pSer/pThr/pTyr-binding forkhead associated (FHA) protein